MSTPSATLYVYGDSYSDISNSNRKTNGPVWSQLVANGWGLQLQSYATIGSQSCRLAGANTLSVASQMDRYTGTINRLNPSNSDTKDVHAFFIGVTDITNATKYDANRLVGCIKEQIVRLQKVDPQAQILILGIPPLEYSPNYADSNKQTLIKKRVNEYNVGLEDMVMDTTRIGDTTTMPLSFIDNNYLFADILGNPDGYGLKEVDKAYWDQCQGRCDDSMDAYLWWDSIHLTGAGHKAIADTIVAKNPFGYAIVKDTSDATHNNSNHTSFTLYSDDYMRYAPWFMLLCLVGVIVLVMFRPKQGRRSILKWSPWKRRKSHTYTAVSSV